MILLTYVDNCIIFSPSMQSINCLLKSMHDGPANFKLTDEGNVNKFLGIKITKLSKKFFELARPFLIDHLPQFLGLF